MPDRNLPERLRVAEDLQDAASSFADALGGTTAYLELEQIERALALSISELERATRSLTSRYERESIAPESVAARSLTAATSSLVAAAELVAIAADQESLIARVDPGVR